MNLKISNLNQWVCEKEDLHKLTYENLKDLQLHHLNRLLEKKSALDDRYPPKLDALEDLCQLPFTTAQMLADNPGKYLMTSQADVSRVISGRTSGTTGPSKRVFYAEEDTENTITFFAAGISEMVSSEDRVLIDFPFSGTSGLGDLIEQAVLSIGAISIRPCPEISYKARCLYVHEKRPNAYIGPSVPLLSLLRFYRIFYPNERFPIQQGLISGDACPENVVSELEKAMGTRLFPHYGSRECGLGGAVTCPAHEGMHLRENMILAEIIDKDLQPVPDGTWCEIVLTTIGLKAMPLIRYRTGDYTRILPDPCPCGCILKRIDRISRLDTEENGLTQEYLDHLLFSIPELLDYKAILNGNHLLLHGLSLDSSCKTSMESLLFNYLPKYSVTAQVLTHLEDAVPFYQGKRFLHHSNGER